MTYQEYIDLGFERTDTCDNVLFKRTGYYGFYLLKKISKKVSIELWQDELDKPKLYIQKPNSEDYFSIPISEESVRYLCS